VVAHGGGASLPPVTHQRYRCSPTGELLPDPTLQPIHLDTQHRYEQAHAWESKRKTHAPPFFEQGNAPARTGNGAGDAEAKTFRVTNGIVANWPLLLDDPNAEQLAPQGTNPSLSLFQYMPMVTDRSRRGENLAETDIHHLLILTTNHGTMAPTTLSGAQPHRNHHHQHIVETSATPPGPYTIRT
jgi:hypothetical protein